MRLFYAFGLLLAVLVCNGMTIEICARNAQDQFVCNDIPSTSPQKPPRHETPVQATSHETLALQALLTTYGKDKVVQALLKQTGSRITLLVNGQFMESAGSPRLDYVTPQTIAMDLQTHRSSPARLEQQIKDAIQEDKAQAAQKTEEKRTWQKSKPIAQSISADDVPILCNIFIGFAKDVVRNRLQGTSYTNIAQTTKTLFQNGKPEVQELGQLIVKNVYEKKWMTSDIEPNMSSLCAQVFPTQ